MKEDEYKSAVVWPWELKSSAVAKFLLALKSVKGIIIDYDFTFLTLVGV